MDATTKFLYRHEAAAELSSRGLSTKPQTLARLAVYGGGPKFRIWGRRPVYSLNELLQWAENRLGRSLSSTSDRDA